MRNHILILQTGWKRTNQLYSKKWRWWCFYYAATVALNHEEIKRDPHKILNIKPFINNYNWNGIKYPSKMDDWKTFGKSNLTIALRVYDIKEREIYPGYISENK